MNLNTLIDLYKHQEWADAAVWNAVVASDEAQTDEKLREYLYHLHIVQRAFLRMWRDEAGETPYPTFEDAKPLMLWAQTYYNEAFEYLKSLDDEKVAEAMPVPWASMVEKRLGRPPDITTMGDTILQVVMHSMYHRGQVNARLRAVGGEPPLVDYIAWVWLGKPKAEWRFVEILSNSTLN